MALKDHILKLADGVSKCQENAKSLAQVIFRGLDDIADNLPDSPGGGSTVEVTQVLSSGTKIASISVDGTPTDLYAPTPTEPTDVDVTQVVSTGTKIATITVDNVPTDLYAPTPSTPVHQYSTTPRIIGKWIDGTTDVYEVVLTGTTNNIGGEEDIDISSLNIDRVYDVSGIVQISTGDVPLNYFADASDRFTTYMVANNTKLALVHFGAWTMQIPYTVILRYSIQTS